MFFIIYVLVKLKLQITQNFIPLVSAWNDNDYTYRKVVSCIQKVIKACGRTKSNMLKSSSPLYKRFVNMLSYCSITWCYSRVWYGSIHWLEERPCSAPGKVDVIRWSGMRNEVLQPAGFLHIESGEPAHWCTASEGSAAADCICRLNGHCQFSSSYSVSWRKQSCLRKCPNFPKGIFNWS